MITPLNLPKAKLELSKSDGVVYVNCLIRKKKLVLTPEEWVRQHVIHFLNENDVPMGLMGVEVGLKYHERSKRADVVVYGMDQKPKLIVECKAPEIELSEAVFRQIASYNYVLQVEFLMMTNGINHIYAKIDRSNGNLEFLENLPKMEF